MTDLDAKVQALRERVRGCAGNCVSVAAIASYQAACDALALIDALQARLAEVERVTVERAAKMCDEIQETNGDESFLPEICAAAIRALSSDAPANPSAP